MRVVVTGGTGLIGRRLIEALRADHDIWSITRAEKHKAGGRLVEIAGDLATDRLPPGLPDRADVVIHLAQSPHYRDFPGQALDVFNVNVASTVRLLDWAHRAGARHFLLASSGGVGAATPQNFYLATRRSAELIAAGYGELIDVLVLRFFFVYGPGQASGMLVPRLIDAIHAGRPVSLAGADGARLNPVHVDDAARAVKRAIETRATGTIDIAGPRTLSIREMAETIASRLGRAATFVTEKARSADVLIGDTTRMRESLHAPRIDFTDGVSDLLGPNEGWP